MKHLFNLRLMLSYLLCGSLGAHFTSSTAHGESSMQTRAREIVRALDKKGWTEDATEPELCPGSGKLIKFDWKNLGSLGGIKTIRKVDEKNLATGAIGPNVYVDAIFNKSEPISTRMTMDVNYTALIGMQLREVDGKICLAGYSLSVSPTH